MTPVPILSPSDVIKLFQRLGWEVVRQKGSHIMALQEIEWVKSLELGLLRRIPLSGASPS
jgi:hypothetical protein